MTSNFIVCCCCLVYSAVLCSFKHFSKFEKIKSASTVKKVLQVYAHSALSCLVILLGPRQLLSVLLTNSAEWLQDLLSLKNQDQFVLWHLFVFTCLTSCFIDRSYHLIPSVMPDAHSNIMVRFQMSQSPDALPGVRVQQDQKCQYVVQWQDRLNESHKTLHIENLAFMHIQFKVVDPK